MIDPLGIIEEYGTDALRFTLLTSSTPGNDMNLSLDRIASNRNFCNKIWNATRFVVSNLEADKKIGARTWQLSSLTLPDRWILSRLHHVNASVNRLIDDFNFGEAGRQLNEFFWSEFADWYIEMAKTRLNSENEHAKSTVQQILVYVLDRVLTMLHPYIPFVTEAAWQHLPHDGDSLMINAWPQPYDGMFDDEAETQMDIIIELIRTIRNIRAEYSVAPGKRIAATIISGDQFQLLQAEKEIFIYLARLDESELQLVANLPEKPAQAASQVISGGVEIYLPLAGMIDLGAEKERLEKERAQLEKWIGNSKGKLSNAGFVDKAPAAVVEKERARLADLELQLAKVNEQLSELG